MVRVKFASLIMAVGLLFSIQIVPNALAAPINDCRIATSPNQTVSLGFPIAPERLKDKSKPKLLVLPFRLSDRPTFTFGAEVKADYFAAANQIDLFSGGKSKPEIVFSEIIDIPDTVADMIELRRNQQDVWQRDETKSTWGFIRRVIALSDQKIDFTGIDGVLLHGSSTSNESGIAEAMMFSVKPRTPWFRTINTAENQLLNAVLFDKHNTISTITHEIMHLYGLTDLYGSSTGPANLSLMASNQMSLLGYEKWILGWVPDTAVQCLIEATEIDLAKTSTRILIPNSKSDQIVVINTGKPGQADVIEISNDGTNQYLAFYSLDNEARPPITMHNLVLGQRTGGGMTITNSSGVGTRLTAPQYSLLISDITESEVILDLIPRAQLANATALFNAAEANRVRIAAAASSKIQVPAQPIIKARPTKKKTIICLNSNKTKKVVTKKSKCPAGFKKQK